MQFFKQVLVLAVTAALAVAQCDKTACSTIFDPVCGSNNQSYTNDCVLKLDACTNKTNVTVAKKGRCTFVSPCDKECPRVAEPQCSPEGVTYGNKCLLEIAACKNPKLDVSKIVDCMSLIMGKCKTECPTTGNRVCGSDGNVYQNACELSNAACDKKSLRAVDCATTPAPTQVKATTVGTAAAATSSAQITIALVLLALVLMS